MHIVDSMFNQHAKWLKVTREEIPWRRADRVAELPAQLPRLAPGPQRLLAPGPGFHRPRREQEGRGDARLPPARREHAALRGGALPREPQLRERDRRRQAARPRSSWTWTRRSSTAPPGIGIWEWASQRPRPRARRRHGLLRRHPDARDARGRRSAAGVLPGTEGTRGQRRRPDASPAARRASARHVRQRIRHAVHDGQADHLRLPRLPVAHPPPHLPAAKPPNLHVRGYKEEGTTTTPFDMVVRNDLDRYHLVDDVIDRVPSLGASAALRKQEIRDKLLEHTEHIARSATTCPRSATGSGRTDRQPAKPARSGRAEGTRPRSPGPEPVAQAGKAGAQRPRRRRQAAKSRAGGPYPKPAKPARAAAPKAPGREVQGRRRRCQPRRFVRARAVGP